MMYGMKNLKIITCNKAIDDKLINISLGERKAFQNDIEEGKKLPVLIFKKVADIIYLFGDIFFEKNQKKMYLIIENKKKNFTNIILFRDFKKEKDIIEKSQMKLKLKIINDLLSMENMLQKDLISIKYLSKLDTKNVTNMSHLFYECKSLQSLPDISKWNTNNVSNMSHLF